MLGAALLRVNTFEDVEHDRGATVQAVLVVVIVSLAAGVGGLGLHTGGTSWDRGIIFGVVSGLISWAVWALAVSVVGTTILKTAQT